MKITKLSLIVLILLVLNVSIRLVFVFYGYIGSEEGFLIYGQKLAYQGLMPFIDYNAWNSLLNNYLLGWYHYLIQPTIVTQRLFGLVISMVVLLCVVSICKHFHKIHGVFIAIMFLSFGSFTYLYYSTIPYSEQTMTLALVVSWLILVKLNLYPRNQILPYIALCSAIVAAPIRPQALPAIVVIWIYLLVFYRARKKMMMSLTITGIIFGILIYLPFMLRGWDNFLYSILWPLQSHKILVYQYYDKIFDFSSLLRFFLESFESYGLFISIIGAYIIYNLFNLKSFIKQIVNDFYHQYAFFVFLCGLSLASMGLLHRPPYATYIYPAIPLFSICASFIVVDLFKHFRSNSNTAKGFLYAFFGLLFFHNLVTFSHADYIKTSLATIHKSTYSGLSEISHYISTKTREGSEIMAFYTPSVVTLNRTLPLNINEGEVSISILSSQESDKYHLVNQQMLRDYILSQKAEAIVLTNKSSRYFGTTEEERVEVNDAIEKYYILDKTFENFSQIGNPRVPYLYFYLKKAK